MATHSSILAWRIPWTEDSGGLLSMGLHRGRHDWSDLACMHALEKEMATHSSIPAWRIPGTEEPHGLLSVGSHRVRHDWSDLAAAAAISEGREVLRHFGMTASLGTKKTKPQLTGTHWHQIKRGKKKKKKRHKIHLQHNKFMCQQTLILRMLTNASDTFSTAEGKKRVTVNRTAP